MTLLRLTKRARLHRPRRQPPYLDAGGDGMGILTRTLFVDRQTKSGEWKTLESRRDVRLTEVQSEDGKSSGFISPTPTTKHPTSLTSRLRMRAHP